MNVLTEFPTVAACGEKAKALAEEAANTSKATFFITAMVYYIDKMGRRCVLIASAVEMQERCGIAASKAFVLSCER